MEHVGSTELRERERAAFDKTDHPSKEAFHLRFQRSVPSANWPITLPSFGANG